MRYRKLSPTGDYLFGHGTQDFLIDSSAAVGQAVLTRLRLFQGEWFLDTSAGMPWNTQVLGTNTQTLYDQAIKNYILETEGVTEILSYSSTLSVVDRSLVIATEIKTTHSGTVALQTKFSVVNYFGYGLGPYGSQPYGGGASMSSFGYYGLGPYGDQPYGAVALMPRIILPYAVYGLVPYDEGSIS